MSRRKLLSLLLIVSCVALISFKNKLLLPAGNFSATMNDSITIAFSSGYYAKPGDVNYITLYALSGGDVKMKFTIHTDTAGTFPINGNNASANYYVTANDVRTAISGNITITSIANNKMSGTFSFADGFFENGIKLTNGIFSDIPLQ